MSIWIKKEKYKMYFIIVALNAGIKYAGTVGDLNWKKQR